MDTEKSAGGGGDSGGSTVSASSFRAKVVQMKNWKPKNTPSNRDKLELYALHKQAVSNDAPSKPPKQASSTNITHLSSPAERAKLIAWQTKRGLSQCQAMIGYILEADRQILIHGKASLIPPQTSFTSPATPRNTPDMRQTHYTNTKNNTKEQEGSCYSQQDSTSLSLTPRGLAAIPLLCAAASESRRAYLERLNSTAPSSPDAGNAVFYSEGWWRKQEPLCGDPGTILALPETAIIVIATALESFSLSLKSITINNNSSSSPRRRRKKSNNNSSNDNNITTTAKDKDRLSTPTTTLSTNFLPQRLIPTTTIQSLLWPLHNTLLVVWILLICLSTATGSTIVAARMMFLGKRTTGTTLEDIFWEEIEPLSVAVKDLCGAYQSLGVRLLGLALYPMGVVCGLADVCRKRLSGIHVSVGGVGDRFGLYVALGVYVLSVTVLWWYWLVVLPWMAIWGIMLSVGAGWCFGLIEFAGVRM